jgi:hypothetical protein
VGGVLLVLLLLAAGLALVLWGALGAGAARDAATAIGQALVVSTVVGGVIDATARRRFAKDVGRSVVLALFGRHAPDRYVDAVERFLAQPRLVDHLAWFVHLAWADTERTVVALTVTRQARGTNVSERAVSVPPSVTISRSVEGFATVMHRYDLDIGDTPVHLTWPDLRRLVEPLPDSDDSVVRLSRVKATRRKIPSKGVFTVAMEVEHRFRSAGNFPLLATVPVLHRQVVVEGPALSDLMVTLYDGGRYVRMTERPGGRLGWESDEVMFPGQMLVLSWRPH